MKAYIARSEQAQVVCAYDKAPAKALKAIAKKIDKMEREDEWLMLTSLNVNYDDEGYYGITAIVTTTNLY